MQHVYRRFLSISSIAFVLIAATASLSAAPSAADLRKRKGFTFKSETTDHLRLHFETGTFAETRIEHLKVAQEKAFSRNLNLLGASTYPNRTDIFFVSSRERMKKLIGEETNGIAYPSTKLVCIVYSETLDASGSHELMHVMAGNIWSLKTKTWLNEGFAGYADDIWHGYKLHDLNKHLLDEKKLLQLESLIDDFREHDHMLSYPQVASFVKFLYEKYGVAKIRAIWDDGSIKRLSRVLGTDIATLEREWHSELKEADATNVKYAFGLRQIPQR